MRGENSKAQVNVAEQLNNEGQSLVSKKLYEIEEPLIYTSIGNVPIKGLEHYIEWQNNPGEIVFIEVYKFQGVEVKRSAHAWKKKGEGVEGKQAKMG